MKFRKIAFAIVLLIIICSSTFAILYKKDNIIKSKTLLISSTYYNNAWAKTFSGVAIFGDGSIYSWIFHGNDADFSSYDIKKKEEFEKYIFDNAKLEKITVSDNDLILINKYMKKINIKDNITFKCMGFDMGSSDISVWIDNDEINLEVSGDCVGKRNDRYSNKLLNIISAYLKKIEQF